MTSAGRLRAWVVSDRRTLLVSLGLQLVLALPFGHVYDMRILMATGDAYRTAATIARKRPAGKSARAGTR